MNQYISTICHLRFLRSVFSSRINGQLSPKLDMFLLCSFFVVIIAKIPR